MTAQALAGAWRLTSCYVIDAHGQKTYPFGSDAPGLLTLQGDGYMAWAMMRANRAPFMDPNPLDGTPQERDDAYASYFSYLGTYRVVDGQIHFSVLLSLFPNWTGTTQVRSFELVDQNLHLTTPMPSGTAHFDFQRTGTL